MAEDTPGGDGDRTDDDGPVSDRRETHGAGDGDATGSLKLPASVLEVVADPSEGRQRLPSLLGLLDRDDPRERLTGATAVCLVAESDPETRPYVVRRLVDRLDDDAPVEVAHALDYLAARHPRDVDETVAELEDEAEQRARQRMYRTGAGFARNEYLARTEGSRPVGRTRVAGGSATDDPRRTYTRDDDAPDWREALDAADGDVAGEGDRDEGETQREASGEADRRRGVTSGTLQLVSRRLSTVVEHSRFDDLAVLDERRRGRYGDVYRTAGAVGGDERAVALVVYRLPESDREAFVGGFRAAMSDWAAVDDHESVLSVYDWDVRPRPWAALDYTDRTLADREDGPRDPLWTAFKLVEAVAHAHQHGTVHGAIDPRNVVYRDTRLTETEHRRPLLANLALAAATGAATPGRGVDPRYAAPEHYDDRFGELDHATDVYGLGVVLYRLYTGRHPYEGDPDTVAGRVVTGGGLTPSAVAPDLPEAFDRVVGKATATRKLKRYETVTTLARELRTIRDG